MTNRATKIIAVLSACVLAGCTSEPQAGQPAPVSTPTTTTSTPPPTTTKSRVPRQIEPLPGGKKIAPTLCHQAQFSMHGAVVGWYGVATSFVEANKPVPERSWEETLRVAPTFKETPTRQRPLLIQAGVPETHVVIKDLDAFLAAVDEELDVARTKDESRVTEVNRKLTDARDNFVESCGAIRS
ncbi:hypothetical protein LWC34_01920 [Kibdelosporangium philippinense]|uniref:DUF305 domain-containing protein n=1 Tax=Kibdelosporangium philippinense TaxID=211113 RepID=A0ABS8Z1F6_9PSEU|nr:hypothetical protein [Kibdelosporangium philippinense]MCE7001605.1 hypothetical protein [Kibdelosporangium philippinense]